MAMMQRRTLLKLVAGLPAVAAAPALAAGRAPPAGRRRQDLCAGAWLLAWRLVLAAGGRAPGGGRPPVYAPSYTGMGDRAHLLSRSITIDTFVEDLVQVIQTEELNDVILVGHSFGGIPITGVADRIPERLAHLVYFDAIVLQSGQNAFSVYPQADADARIAAASKATDGLAVPIPDPIPRPGVSRKAAPTTPGSSAA